MATRVSPRPQAASDLAASAGMRFLIADGKVVYANRSGEEALGLGPDAPSQAQPGCEVFQLVAVAPEYLELSRESFRRRLQGEDVAPADCALLTRDGRRIEGVFTSRLVVREGRRQLIGIFTGKKASA